MLFQKKAAFFEIKDWEKNYIKKNLKGFSIQFYEDPLSSANVSKIKSVEVLGVFIYSKVTKEVIDSMPKLKIVCTMSTGFDHIDVAYANSKGIIVCNVPYYGDNTVAEHAFALILSLSRKIQESVHRTRKGDFSFDGLVGFDLKGKTLGVIGTGRISSCMIKIAKGFDMNVLGYDAIENPDLMRNYGLKYVDINTLLKNSDIVSLHVPLNNKTKHIINSKNIGYMKPTALLINTARGGLIETDALYKALVNKKIAGAGLDVLEEEAAIKEEKQLLSKEYTQPYDNKTMLENHMFLRFTNVLITPHNAFNSNEALQRILEMTIENINAYKAKTPRNMVGNK
jgi:D-lactate dehydrogenase